VSPLLVFLFRVVVEVWVVVAVEVWVVEGVVVVV